MKGIFGVRKRLVFLKDIHTYNEMEKRNKYFKWIDLTLFYKNKSYKISSTRYTNYETFKPYLIHGKERNIASEKEWQRKNGKNIGIGVLTFGIVLLSTHLHIHGFTPENLKDFWFGLVCCALILIFGIYLLRISTKI